MAGQPAAEHPIDAALARDLLAEQHPDLADLPITPAASGWDNAMFRLGEALALRLPRRAVAAELLATEQRWLPELAASLPLPIPAPVRVGRPGCGYPWGWSVTPWLAGEPAERTPLNADQGEALGGFLRALHREAPPEAPFNPYRSVDLRTRAAIATPQLERLAAARPDLATDALWRTWAEALDAEVDLPPGWIHGDLHARNVLSQAGTLSGVLDWGDMARGDPAMDLYSLWMLLPDAGARAAAIRTYGGLSKPTLSRARGWSVAMAAVMLMDAAASDPAYGVMGERTLRALKEGP